ncbi:NAD(P)-dependent oxidoreductase [Amycolatopsis sp. K13G38]|uniref:NAD(P)-dependent oxidoreductase n=1 Tax=Amycolatopsis acididurans TaxID=2724524 RepID=A0ABX1IVZ4_9PSEU|nr:NAD(P)-dependent oxidoreductase [Amycolatopsis acididurans]NKQ51479.1 NAD(P)-dependent oxidoreductase [Amycolatopsis acididurans]
MITGFVGLGNMGAALAANLVGAGHSVIAHDALGPDRAPVGSSYASTVEDLARAADAVVFSLPDGKASEQVAREIIATGDRRVRYIVDTSTIGVTAARTVAALLDGIGYVDAPVSGGVAGARARTLAVMYSGSDADCAAVAPVLAGLSDRTHWVGDRPGMAQALKLANNFLSATALAATSEAVAFGTAAGLDMSTMLTVLDGSSGRNGATGDKFPNHVLTGRYASGFTNSLMSKDVRLYLNAVADQGGRAPVAQAITSVWEGFAAAEPGADFTRIYPYVEGGDNG